MRIAVQGCGHGQLDQIYNELDRQTQDGNIVDLLIICGDFQAMRNHVDVQSMACPPKYRRLGRFHEYYSGHKKAPVLTIVIGGNHESASYMWELYWGGWLAPNIYYLGAAAVVNIKLKRAAGSPVEGLRLAGMSGIYKPYHYNMGHYERPPFHSNSGDLHSIYHVRRFDSEKLMQIREPVDIMLSHDWPRNIYHHGDLEMLLKRKPFFKADIDNGSLGSPPLEKILHQLKPSNWFAAHMHVNFKATVVHSSAEDNSDGDEPSSKKAKRGSTQFEALDKCGPNKIHFKIFEIESPTRQSDEKEPIEIADNLAHLYYDVEWLAITRAANDLLSVTKSQKALPERQQLDLDMHREWIKENVADLKVPDNFCQTAPGLGGDYRYRLTDQEFKEAKRAHINPQSIAFCQMLQMSNKFADIANSSSDVAQRQSIAGDISVNTSATDAPLTEPNHDEIIIDDFE